MRCPGRFEFVPPVVTPTTDGRALVPSGGTYAAWGPLANLVGTWQSGWEGVDVSYHNDQGKLTETRYRETTSFQPFGPIQNGDQRLFGLDYRTAAYRVDRGTPFHTEVGYWMWDETNNEVIRCFIVPQGTTLIAGATVEPDATHFQLTAILGSNTYGILSNPHLDRFFRTTRYDVTVTVDDETYAYDGTTVVEHVKHPAIILHADRNRLHRISGGS